MPTMRTKSLRPESPLMRAAIPDEAPLTFLVEETEWYGVTSDWKTLYAASSSSSGSLSAQRCEASSENFESWTGGGYDRPGNADEICCRLKTTISNDIRMKYEFQRHSIEIHNCSSIVVHLELEFRHRDENDEFFLCTTDCDGYRRWTYTTKKAIDDSLRSSDVQKSQPRQTNIRCLQVRPLHLFGDSKKKKKACGAAFLWGDEKFSDVLIKCKDDVSLKAHRCVLSTNSGDFEKILSSEFKEGREQEINVVLGSSDMRKVLEFCYTGKCELDVQYAYIEALVADIYEVEPLKQYCWDRVAAHFFCSPPLGILDLFVLAAEHYNPELKKWALSVIRKSDIKLKDVQGTMLCERPKLLVELFAGWVNE